MGSANTIVAWIGRARMMTSGAGRMDPDALPVCDAFDPTATPETIWNGAAKSRMSDMLLYCAKT